MRIYIVLKPKDIHYAFFGNVVRGKSALFRLVVRNGFAHFVRKVFARKKLLPGKFWVFVPLLETMGASTLWPPSSKLMLSTTAVQERSSATDSSLDLFVLMMEIFAKELWLRRKDFLMLQEKYLRGTWAYRSGMIMHQTFFPKRMSAST